MAECYEMAALRHWADSILLEKENRVANADHLFAFAAECAIKVALSQLPGFVNNGNLASHYLVHMDELWNRIQLQNLQRRFPALMATLKSENPFRDWSVNQRYEDGSAILPAVKDRHRDAARRILGAVGLTGIRQGD